MNSIRNSLIVVLLFSSIYGFAQNTDMVKKKGPADEYSRSSVSYLLLDFQNEKYSTMINKAINTTSIPSKYDFNDLSKKIMPAPYIHSTVPLAAGNTEKIRQALVANNYAIDVVKYWWKIQEDGAYSTSLIAKRGEYNATDDVVSTVDASKVGRAKLADLGLKLIGNSYVLVLDYSEVVSRDDEYDAIDAAAREVAEKNKTEFVPVKRTENGFKGRSTSYLFKINYPDTVQGYFDAAFIDDKTIDIQKLNEIFNQVYSPLVFVTSSSDKIQALQYNPGETLAPTIQQTPDQLMVKFVNTGILKSIDNIETKLEAFRVKAPVTNVDPIRAKIGRKEDLKHEKRYFVWQYAESNGAVVAKKKGVIRARKVVDNRTDELGKTSESTFYQVGGGLIKEGMTLQERKDFGMGIGFGYGAFGGVYRAEINVGQLADAKIRQLKLYGELTGKARTYTDPVEVDDPKLFLTIPADTKFSQTIFAIGILKEYPFARNFMAGWQIGYNGETISFPSGDNTSQFSSGGINWGLRFGTNLLSPSFKVIASLSGYNLGTVTYKSGVEGAEDIALEALKSSDFLSDKPSVGFDISFRLTF